MATEPIDPNYHMDFYDPNAPMSFETDSFGTRLMIVQDTGTSYVFPARLLWWDAYLVPVLVVMLVMQNVIAWVRRRRVDGK